MKPPLSRKFIASFALLTFSLFAFQNCGKSFSSSSGGSASLSSSALGHGAPHITSLASKMIPNANLEFKLFQEVTLSGQTYMWAHQLNGVANACQIMSGSIAQNYIVNCKNEGSLKVSVEVHEVGKKIAVQDFIVPLVPGSPAPVGSLTAKFVIPSGTGNGPWNTAATAIEVYVGQTLTFQNNDTINHQMHTGGKPCPHGTAAIPGASFNCVITQAYDSVVNGGLYDHAAGTAARVYLIAHDGAQLYTQNCMSCYGELSVSQRRNASIAQIRNALASVSQMSTIANLMKLTPKQIEAISYALSK